jgi:hypothetical protein
MLGEHDRNETLVIILSNVVDKQPKPIACSINNSL